MEFGINNKLKVVWICHFTNENIQNKLNVRKKINEFAPWITLGIEEAKKRKDIELHIVAPHRWIIRNKEFIEENIHYHFFNPGIPICGRHWPRFFRWDILTNFYHNKLKVKRYIQKINPDIIHLHGIENAYYSSTVLQFNNKNPIIVSIQGLNTLLKIDNLNNLNKRKEIKIEIESLKTYTNFGVRTKEMMNHIKNYNNQAVFYWHEYFLNIPKEHKYPLIVNKQYDIIFFARVSKAKGVEDLIKVTGLLKKEFPNIKTAIIGSTSKEYLNFLTKLAHQYKCNENIDFLGFQPTQEDVYKILLQSKICVLPTYNDTIPGTIIESMYRRIPVVSYKTGGIPDLNEKEEVVLLSEQGNINGLHNNIKKLLNNPEYSKLLAEKAYKYATARWDNEKAMEDIIKAYRTILDENHTPLNRKK